MANPKILYEDNHILVVLKPINMPTQEDNSKDPDLFNYLKSYIKNKYNKPGNAYLGLVHRLDRPVGGIMVFAKTSKAASRLSEQIRLNEIKKTYYAIIQGVPDKKDEFIDYLLKDEKTNMVKVSNKGKQAILNYELISSKNGLSLVKINLKTGRSHQIRVQFSSRGLPLFGDQRYNDNSKVGQQIALFSSSLCFKHPVKQEEMKFDCDLPDTYPWNIF